MYHDCHCKTILIYTPEYVNFYLFFIQRNVMTVPAASAFDTTADRKRVSALCKYFKREDTDMR